MNTKAELYVRPVDHSKPHGRVEVVDARWDDEGMEQHHYWSAEFESLGELCRRMGIEVPASLWERDIAEAGEACLYYSERHGWDVASAWPEC